MNSNSLYISTVLIWGSTWFAIKFQLGVVAPEISLVYRFALSSILLLLFCLATGRSLRYRLIEHGFIALQGLFLFSSNYLVFYWASGLLTSGVVALLFSTVVLMNIINGAVWLKSPVSPKVVLGACIGIAGVAAVFWSEVSSVGDHSQAWYGLWLCLGATFLASIGNILSARNQRHQIPVVQTNALGMAYGSLIMLIFVLYSGAPFNYDSSPAYTASLLYLSVFGSILAFGCYLTLIGRIGADKAAYAAVLFPVVALALSTLFEDYHWSDHAAVGFMLVLLGNFLVLSKGRKAAVVA